MPAYGVRSERSACYPWRHGRPQGSSRRAPVREGPQHGQAAEERCRSAPAPLGRGLARDRAQAADRPHRGSLRANRPRTPQVAPPTRRSRGGPYRATPARPELRWRPGNGRTRRTRRGRTRRGRTRPWTRSVGASTCSERAVRTPARTERPLLCRLRDWSTNGRGTRRNGSLVSSLDPWFLQATGRTFAAWGPFWPCVTSNSTCWPSSRFR
jgi:hypothetical protein